VTVTPADLTGTERAVLLVLMAEARPMPNPDLVALGPKLDKPGRDKLNRLGLIESHRSGGRFVHELTDRGWRLCRDIFSDGAPVSRGVTERGASTGLSGDTAGGGALASAERSDRRAVTAAAARAQVAKRVEIRLTPMGAIIPAA
jgi:hypothetical protein